MCDKNILNFKALPSYPFFTGRALASCCQHTYDSYPCTSTYAGHQTNPIANDVYFVKTDFLGTFQKEKPNKPYVIITHNSDYSIGQSGLLDDPNLVKWYGINIAYKHPKLVSIPLGFANIEWATNGPKHGQADVLAEIIKTAPAKNNKIYASFNVSNAEHARRTCLQQTGVGLTPRVPFRQYATDLAQSYFSLAPQGNGIDTHRLWESLYVRTIPITLRNINTSFYEKYPIILLNDWTEYKNLDLSPANYNKIWNNFDPSKLFLDNYIKEEIPEIITGAKI